MLAILLLVIGVFSRLIVHVPNFTPIIALALFGGVYLKKTRAVLLPLALFLITDMIIGFHNIMIFTWGSVIVIAAIGLWIKERKNFKIVLGSSIGSAILFFVITNFGVWMLSGMYTHTWAGLADCYIKAIPFFRGTLLSTLIYTVVFFGSYELIATRVRNTKLAHVLL